MSYQFKKGDRVRSIDGSREDVVKKAPGMDSYDCMNFYDAASGFVLENSSWERQKNWLLIPKYSVNDKVEDNTKMVDDKPYRNNG